MGQAVRTPEVVDREHYERFAPFGWMGLGSTCTRFDQ